MLADPILALQSLGYTEREASFLHLVAVHSRYFLRRQFDYFIDRQPGAIAQRFLEKTRSMGHVRYVDCGESRYVYQLFSKPIYRLIGNADSQNRHWKGDGMIRARLMALDYVLENEGAHFLISEAAKTHFFSAVRRIPEEFFTDCNGRLLPLLRRCRSRLQIERSRRPPQCDCSFPMKRYSRKQSSAASLLRLSDCYGPSGISKRYTPPFPNTRFLWQRKNSGGTSATRPPICNALFRKTGVRYIGPRYKSHQTSTQSSVPCFSNTAIPDYGEKNHPFPAPFAGRVYKPRDNSRNCPQIGQWEGQVQGSAWAGATPSFWTAASTLAALVAPAHTRGEYCCGTDAVPNWPRLRPEGEQR